MTALPEPIGLAEAQQRLFRLIADLGVDRVSPSEGCGRFLAAPLTAQRTAPPADLSAMDGYAINSKSTGGWEIVGESAAGAPFATSIEPGECVRISTGAHMPKGADAVLLQELAKTEGKQIMATGPLPPSGKHIRPAGFDFKAGDEVLPAGTLIGPAQTALVLAAGHRQIAVGRQPSLAILDSGSELSSDPGAAIGATIPASNGPMLEALARPYTRTMERIGPVPDKLDALTQALNRARNADILVTSGGASVGDHDLLRPALEAVDAQIEFWRVKIRPGKPLMIATRPGQTIIGLPGNPVSCFVTGILFLLPALRAMAGAAAPLPAKISVPLGAALRAGGRRREFIRAYWNGETVTPLASQDSAGLLALSQSNALIERDSAAKSREAGDLVGIYPLN